MTLLEALHWCSAHDASLHFTSAGLVWVTYNVPNGAGHEQYTLRAAATDQDPVEAVVRAVVQLIDGLERVRKQEITLEQLIKKNQESF